MKRALRWRGTWISLWLLLLAALAMGGHRAGLAWALSVPLAVIGVFVAMVLRVRVGRRVDARRGLALREWKALSNMYVQGRSRDKANFDRVALSSTQGVNEEVLTAYATIMVNLMITSRFGAQPTGPQLDELVAEVALPWRTVMRRDPESLRQLLRAACAYQRDGYPEPTWDNYRSLAAAAGALSRVTPPLRGSRRAVLTEYQRSTAPTVPQPPQPA